MDSSIRIVLPSRQYFKTHGVTGSPGEDVLKYLLDGSVANVNTIPEAIRRADVFRDVSIEYYETPGRPNAARGEFALWLQLPDPRSLTWTLLAGPDNTEQRLLTVTGLDQGAVARTRLAGACPSPPCRQWFDGRWKSCSGATRFDRRCGSAASGRGRCEHGAPVG